MKKSRFKAGEVCYYVNPFGHNIDKVLLEIQDDNIEDGKIYFIEASGALLPEWDLAKTLDEARLKCHQYLDRFYFTKINEINMCNPELDTF